MSAEASTEVSVVPKTHVFRAKAHVDLRPYIKSEVRSHPDTFHRVTFAVKQLNDDLLEEKLMDVSDPKSPKYGQHCTE